MKSKEERIRKRAYALWKEDRSIDGSDGKYWRKPMTLLEEELLQAQTGGSSQARSFAPRGAEVELVRRVLWSKEQRPLKEQICQTTVRRRDSKTEVQAFIVYEPI